MTMEPYEEPPTRNAENCAHQRVIQISGWSAYRDSHYKCKDCQEVAIADCNPQSDNPFIDFGEVV